MTAGNRPRAGWADDFPAGVTRLRLVTRVSNPRPKSPGARSWLILVDGVASGTLGFKGDP